MLPKLFIAQIETYVSMKKEQIRCTIFIWNYRDIILFVCEKTENLLLEKYHNACKKDNNFYLLTCIICFICIADLINFIF